MKEVNKEFDAKMQKTIDVVMSDFASVRAGRANAAVLDKITEDYYGAPTPLYAGERSGPAGPPGGQRGGGCRDSAGRQARDHRYP